MAKWRKITRGILSLKGKDYHYGDVFIADEKDLPPIVRKYHVEKVEPPKRTKTAKAEEAPPETKVVNEVGDAADQS